MMNDIIKVLFLIRDLGHGGAEKVLVNLVNHMDKERFDITVMTLFDEGVNRQFLAPHIKYKSCFKRSIPGNSHILKLFSPEFLHNALIKEHFDIEIAYLEGPSSRIISGCKNKNTSLVSWIHCTQNSEKDFSVGFRSFGEAQKLYSEFDKIAFVSDAVEKSFRKFLPNINSRVIYNTNDTKKIIESASEDIGDTFSASEINLISTGRIIPVKGFDRLARIHAKLISDGYPVHTYILGEGADGHKAEIEKIITENNIKESFTFLGYQINPYKYVSKSDLFVCSSHSEGFSTAATEALIVGTPVCTTKVSGMEELLGKNNKYGIITENDENALYDGIKSILDDSALLEEYKQKAIARGGFFSTAKTVKAAEDLFVSILKE